MAFPCYKISHKYSYTINYSTSKNYLKYLNRIQKKYEYPIKYLIYLTQGINRHKIYGTPEVNIFCIKFPIVQRPQRFFDDLYITPWRFSYPAEDGRFYSRSSYPLEDLRCLPYLRGMYILQTSSVFQLYRSPDIIFLFFDIFLLLGWKISEVFQLFWSQHSILSHVRPSRFSYHTCKFNIPYK